MVAWRPPQPVRCMHCQGETWDNTMNKRTPRSPDYKCRDKTCGWACWLDEEPNHWNWRPPLSRRMTS